MLSILNGSGVAPIRLKTWLGCNVVGLEAPGIKVRSFIAGRAFGLGSFLWTYNYWMGQRCVVRPFSVVFGVLRMRLCQSILSFFGSRSINCWLMSWSSRSCGAWGSIVAIVAIMPRVHGSEERCFVVLVLHSLLWTSHQIIIAIFRRMTSTWGRGDISPCPWRVLCTFVPRMEWVRRATLFLVALGTITLVHTIKTALRSDFAAVVVGSDWGGCQFGRLFRMRSPQY